MVVPDERSEKLAELLAHTSSRATVLRAGAGLVATIPFAVASGLASPVDLVTRIGTVLAVPVALALTALVGLAASTIGVSLLAAPISPEDAADAGARGVLRTGLLLLGLTPLTILWSLSYEAFGSIVVPSLAWGLAGLAGIVTIDVRVADAMRRSGHEPSLRALGVLALFSLFAFVVGIRVWFPLVQTLFPGFES